MPQATGVYSGKNPKGVVLCPVWHCGAKPVRDVNQQKDYKIMGVEGLWKHGI